MVAGDIKLIVECLVGIEKSCQREIYFDNDDFIIKLTNKAGMNIIYRFSKENYAEITKAMLYFSYSQMPKW